MSPRGNRNVYKALNRYLGMSKERTRLVTIGILIVGLVIGSLIGMFLSQPTDCHIYNLDKIEVVHEEGVGTGWRTGISRTVGTDNGIYMNRCWIDEIKFNEVNEVRGFEAIYDCFE
jgi:hypothetical protein